MTTCRMTNQECIKGAVSRVLEVASNAKPTPEGLVALGGKSESATNASLPSILNKGTQIS